MVCELPVELTEDSLTELRDKARSIGYRRLKVSLLDERWYW